MLYSEIIAVKITILCVFKNADVMSDKSRIVCSTVPAVCSGVGGASPLVPNLSTKRWSVFRLIFLPLYRWENNPGLSIPR
jgi:hypothetical protein